jgi:hypothetical protein
MSYEDFGAVVKVHLYGAFNTSRAAADGDVPGGSLIAWVKPAPPLILRQAHGSLRGRPRCYDGLPHVGVRGLDGSKWCSRSRDSAPQSRERSCPRHTSWLGRIFEGVGREILFAMPRRGTGCPPSTSRVA